MLAVCCLVRHSRLSILGSLRRLVDHEARREAGYEGILAMMMPRNGDVDDGTKCLDGSVNGQIEFEARLTQSEQLDCPVFASFCQDSSSSCSCTISGKRA